MRLWLQDATLAQRVAPLLSVLVLGTLLNGLLWIPYQTQLAYGWTSLTMWSNFAAVTVLVPAILWTVPKYGAMGAAWIWVILNVSYCLFSMHFMYRRILPQEKWYWFRQDVMAPLGAGILAAKCLQLLWPTWQGNIADLALLVLAASFTLSVSLLTSNEIRQPLFKLIKIRLMRRSIAQQN